MIRVWTKHQARFELMEGQECAEIPILYGTTKYNCSVGREGDIAADSSDWKNETMAKYYGLKEIKGIKQE